MNDSEFGRHVIDRLCGVRDQENLFLFLKEKFVYYKEFIGSIDREDLKSFLWECYKESAAALY